MKTTLNHYNKKNRRHRNKTQRKGKKKHGGSTHSIRPGEIYNFDKKSNNLDMLNDLMSSEMPLIVRHHRKSCPHCEDFEKPWSVIESRIKGHPSYSVASLDDYATEHVANNYPKYPRLKGVPTVVLVNNREPIEHTGPNTLQAIEDFLTKHGLQIKLVPIESMPPASVYESDSMPPLSGSGSESASDSMPPLSVSGSASESNSMPPLSGSVSESVSESASMPPLSSSFETPSVPPSDAEPSILSKVQATISGANDSLKSGLEKLATAATEPINFNNLFSSDSNALPPPALNAPLVVPPPPLNAPLDAPKPLLENNQPPQQPQQPQPTQIMGTQQVPPSLVGGKTRRKKKYNLKSKRSK